MPSRVSSCVVGIDVGGTNTDAVVLQNDQVLAWHKTHTTRDIQSGVENAIEAVMTKGNISAKEVQSVKIGTTVSVASRFLHQFHPTVLCHAVRTMAYSIENATMHY